MLLFILEHGVPCRQTDGLLFQHVQNVLRAVLLVDDHTEHVFVEPLVRHDEMALIAGIFAPTVFHHPFLGLAVIVEVDGHQRHGVGAAAVEALDALFLVHAERRAEETAVVVVVQVERTFLGIQELTHVATEVHHGAVFQAGNGHFFDVLDRQIDVQPIVSVVSVTVIINFIYLVERTCKSWASRYISRRFSVPK